MGWLDWFREVLLKEPFKGLITINNNFNGNIKITNSFNSKPESPNPVSQSEDGSLIIDTATLNPAQRELIKRLITELYLDDGNPLLESKTASLLDSLTEFQNNPTSEERRMLEFFKPPLIPDADYECLKISLFLVRAPMERRRQIKEDISARFGSRGSNIANLCFAGYFQNWFIPLHNQHHDRFIEYYEVVVGRQALALFVSEKMDSEAVNAKIQSQITVAKKYGLPAIYVHGLGAANVSTIKDCLSGSGKIFNVMKKHIFEEKGFVIVELII